MKGRLLLSMLPAMLLCWSQHALADNTQHCLQLYYMKSYEHALPFCLLSAENDNSQSQYVLGLMYADGQGVQKDRAEAIKWFQAAAKQGYAAALYKLQKLENESSDDIMARLLAMRKKPTTPQPAQAEVQMTEAGQPTRPAESATRPAESRLQPATALPETATPPAVATVAPEMTSPLPQKQPDETAASASSPADALMAEQPTAEIEPGDKQRFETYLQAAEEGDVHAQFMLGMFYSEGRGVARDDVQAAGLFRLAAERGNPQAQLSLGLMYHEGRGVEQNEAMAVHWLTRAAEQGVADAQYGLGLIYATGSSGVKNEAEAARWWRRAAEQKHANARHNLAVMYLKGIGVEANREKAIYWLHQEAELGNPEAQFNLGRLYSEGKWLDKSGGEAANWYYRAGEAWLALGKKSEARKSAEKIRQLSSELHLTVPNIFLADVLSKKIEESEPLHTSTPPNDQ